MTRKILLSGLLILFIWGFGQAQSNITQGTKAKLTVISQLRDGISNFLSEDKKHICGSIGSNAGFIYRIANDSVVRTLEDRSILGMVSPDCFVGDMDGQAYIFRNGETVMIEVPVPDPSPEWGKVTTWAYDVKGEVVVGMYHDSALYRRTPADTNFIYRYNYGATFDGKTGKLLKTLKPVWPRSEPINNEDNIGYGSRVDCISDDTKMLGGHSSHPGSFSNWTPTIWDLSDPNKIHATAVNPDRFCQGSFYGANANGSIFVGTGDDCGLIAYYDKTTHTITKLDSIFPTAGFDQLSFSDISENGIMIGFQGIAADPGSRVALIYTQNNGLVTMNDFLYELYDLNLKSTQLWTPHKISSDGKIITGTMLGYFPWFVELGDTQIYPRARTFSARAASSSALVKLDWSNPIKNQHTLKGFNIYRDEAQEKINTNLLSPNTLSFTDNNVATGTHIYYIETVYEEGTSPKAVSNKVLVVDGGECLPVQELTAEVKYNKFATIYWGLPSSEVINANNVAPKGPIELKGKVLRFGSSRPSLNIEPSKSYVSKTFDYITALDMHLYTGYSGILVGDFYYISSHSEGGIKVYDRNNNLRRVIEPTGLSVIYSMVHHNNKLYCGGPTGVFSINPETGTIDDFFPVDSGVRHMTYIPSIDGGKGGFEIGDWDNSYYYSLDGKRLGESGFDFKNLAVSGTAYSNGSLYVYSQTGKYTNEIYTYDFATQKAVDKPYQVTETPALYNLLSFNGEVDLEEGGVAVAGGLSLCVMEDNTIALGAVLQCSYVTCRLALFEIESAPTSLGYDLYRNGVKINGASPLQSRIYKEELNTDGVFYYQVKARTTEGCTSAFSPSDTLVITPKGSCWTPSELKAFESNECTSLSWGIDASASNLVGFNIYRDNELIEQLWTKRVSLEYVDCNVELGEHNYRVEGFYASACTASDSIKLTITGEGKSKAPFGIQLTGKENSSKVYDVSATWESPLFEEPLALRYGSGMWNNGLSFSEDYTEYWGAIGWDKADCALYQDLYLVGMEYLVGNDVLTFESIVYLNDTLAYANDEGRIRAKQWNTVWFNKSFSMNQPKEVVVGYHASYAKGTEGVIAIDMSYNKPFYSDLLSMDGVDWSSLSAGKYPSSWCIAGLVVRKRDVENATKNGVLQPELLEGKVMRLVDQNLLGNHTQTQAISKPVYSPKENLSLRGFNIYRRGAEEPEGTEVKLNTELLKTYTWLDKNAAEGEYYYTVGAVYSNDKEEMAEKYILLQKVGNEDVDSDLKLTLFPNPATETVRINGEYQSVVVYNASGKIVFQSQTPRQEINVSELTSGTYFFHFTTQKSKMSTYKLIVR